MMDPRPLAMRIGRAERISVAAAVTAAWLAIASCGSTGRQHASALLPTHDDSIETTLFLVGDAGAPGPPGQSACWNCSTVHAFWVRNTHTVLVG